MMKKKILIMVIAAGLILPMVSTTPVWAAKKTTVVLPKGHKTSKYNDQKKKWKVLNSSSATFNKKGMITSATDTLDGSVIWSKTVYKYNKKGLLKSLKIRNNGNTQIYKWTKKGRKCTITLKQNGKTLPGKDVMRFNKDGKILSAPEYTYKYTKSGKYKEILHTYVVYDDEEDDEVTESEKIVFEYDKKDRLISRTSYVGDKVSGIMKWYYKNNKLIKGTTIQNDYNEDGTVDTYGTTAVFKYKKAKITATIKNENGNPVRILVFDKKYKAYNPIPDLLNPEFIESVIPYESTSRKEYDEENGTISYETTSKYTTYKKGAKKGLVKTRIDTDKDYDEDGNVEIEKIKTVYSYTTKKMTKYDQYIQGSFFGFRDYLINTIGL